MEAQPITLIGAAVGAYVHSQTGDTIGFVLLWLPLPLVFLALFSAVGLSLLPVLILVFTMAEAGSIVEESHRQRK